MSCDGLAAVNPVCVGIGASQAPGQVASSLANDAFSNVAQSFGQAAGKAAAWLWKQINDATTLDLHSPALVHELTVTGAIAAVLCVALFAIQIIKGALWRDPGALRRGVTGLGVSFLGSAFAIATTQVLLTAVDQLSSGVVQATMGTNEAGLGTKLIAGGAVSNANAAILLLISCVVLVACVVVWAAMMIRKLMILVAAILAPLAFAGAAADLSRSWVRRWIEFVAAMIASKLLLVLILSIGVTIINGGGQSGTGAAQTTTQVIGGALILLLGGLSPWMAIKLFTFAGESLHMAHMSAVGATSGGRAMIAAPQKVAAMGARATAVGGAAAGLARTGAGHAPHQRGGATTPVGMPPPHKTAPSGGRPAVNGAQAGAGSQRPASAAGSAGPAPAHPSSTTREPSPDSPDRHTRQQAGQRSNQ